MSTLRACCLVSKSFLPPARAKLYSSVLFTVVDGEGAESVKVLKASIFTFFDTPSSHLLNTMFLRPELGAHVERAQIHINSRATRAGRVAAEVLGVIHRNCPRLSALIVEDQYDDNDDIDKAIARFGCQLRSLSNCSGRSLGQSGMDFLGRLSELKCLEGVAGVELNLIPSSRPPFQLASFKSALEIDPHSLQFILHNSHTTLTSLELSTSPGMEEEGWDLSSFVALKSLALQISGGWPVCWYGGNTGEIPTIKSCRALRQLKLWAYDLMGMSAFPDSPPVDQGERFLHHLPPTLTTLALTTCSTLLQPHRRPLGPLDRSLP